MAEREDKLPTERVDFRRAVEYFQQQDFDSAISLLGAYDGSHFDSVHILGACYAAKKEYAKAFEYFGLAFELEPKNLMLNLNMAKTYAMAKEYVKAAEHAEICLVYDSDNSTAKQILRDVASYNSANNADYRRAIELYNLGDYDLALELFEKHLASFSGDGLCLEYIGIVHCEKGNYELGLHYFYAALSYKQDRYSIYYNIASAFFYQEKYGQAYGSATLCLAYNSEYKEALYLLSKVHQERGEFVQAAKALRDHLTIEAGDKLILSDLMYYNLHLLRWKEIELDLAELFSGDYSILKHFPALLLLDDLALLRKITSSYALPASSPDIDSGSGIVIEKPPRNRDKIRVGYISSDVGYHPVFYISAHLFCEHDRDNFEVYLYSTSSLDKEGAPIEIAEGRTDCYRDLRDLSDGAAYDIICGDDLDILVDLIGYTGGKGSRRALLAMEGLARVLINYLGYMGTMSTSYHDYIIADRHIILAEHAEHYSEDILYVDCVFAYDRSLLLNSRTGGSRSDFGLPEGGVILAVFNQAVKVTESMFIAWMGILESCDDSYLWVSFKLECSRLEFIERVKEHGISLDRLIASRNIDANEYMCRYEFCDLCLDTYPYNGGMTSLDSLHGCCPILTMSGETMMSRVTASLLGHLGLDELVADSFDDYVDKGIALVRDRKKLKALRKHIGDRLSGSAIYDSEKMTRQLEEHYRAIVSKKLIEG